MPDYYAILDLPTTATLAQIDARYRQFVRMFDPTLYAEPDERAYVEKKLRAAEAAYQALSSGVEGSEKKITFPQFAQNTIFLADSIQNTVEFVDPAGARWRIPLSTQFLNSEQPLRWLKKFGLSVATVFVAALIGFTMLNQGLGVLAYVTHQRQSADTPVTQSAITPHSGEDWTPIYSADRRQVVFLADVMGEPQIFLNYPAGQKRQVTHSVQLRSRPAWSPQGDKLAFLQANSTGVTIQIFVLATGRFYSFQPSQTPSSIGRVGWSDDGKSIFFEQSDEQSASKVELWSIDSIGQQLQRYREAHPPAVTWWEPLP